ncbi:MAG: SDR family NAD(P)-dependent oxidoreductase [Pseudomonadota bacterium]
MRLENKVALVTGGASGIGAATAKRFSEEGATVFLADVSADAAENSASELTNTEAMAFDVSDAEAVNAAVEKITSSHGRIDVLVNNAGILDGDPRERKLWLDQAEAELKGLMSGQPSPDPWSILSESSLEAWDRLLKVNLTGTFNCVKACAPHMGRGGSIVNLSSVSAVLGHAGLPGYSASKAGVLGLTRNLAIELGPKGIRVNAVLPGAISTPMMGEHPQLLIGAFVMQSALKRLGDPVEVANTILFLGSDEASYVTGQQISPNGGIWM